VANNNFPINVNVNFNGVSYNAATRTWTGQPSWTVTPNLQGVPPVKLGVNTNTITWNLNAAAVPQGFTAAFTSPAITFAASPAWTGGAPGNTNNTTCVASDNFNGLPANEVFEYTISVTLSNGSVTQAFTYDPDIENETGTVNVAALVRTRK